MSSRLKADLMLLLTAVIWGLAFVAQRVAALETGIFLFNAARFGVGAAALSLFAWVSQRRSLDNSLPAPSPIRQIWIMGLAGSVLFLGSALQQAGLQYTTAANAGFITGLYVVIVPVLLAVLLRRKITWNVWLAALVAAVGLYLLANGGPVHINPGDWLELAGAFAWAGHVLVVAWAMRQMPLVRFSIGQALWAGALHLGMSLWVELPFAAWQAQIWLALLYVGIFSTAVGYTLQAAGQRHAPETDAAFLLTLEAVFAAIFGFLILGETLLPVQIAGCGLLLGAVLLAQFRFTKRSGLPDPNTPVL
jgi:drug/metabolite transporter (DMT)-like permease